jgi:hypothetical protein
MAKSQPWLKILNHLDRDEIISKIAADISADDIHEWLSAKYSLGAEKQYVLSVQALKSFRENYFDFYQTLKSDVAMVKSAAPSEQLDAIVKNSPAYMDALKGLVNHEVDLKLTISRLCVAIETRMGQIYDLIQEEYSNDPRSINTKIDYVLIQYVNAISPLLEKANKIINEAPDQIIQHNVSVQHIDQTVGVFYEAIRETLSEMNLEFSMIFMESFSEKLKRIQDPSTTPANRLQEVKALNTTINAALDV